MFCVFRYAYADMRDNLYSPHPFPGLALRPLMKRDSKLTTIPQKTSSSSRCPEKGIRGVVDNSRDSNQG